MEQNEEDQLNDEGYVGRASNLEDTDENGKPLNICLFRMSMKRDIGYYIASMFCLIALIFSFVFVAIRIEWDAFIWRVFVAFGCFMVFCIILLEVNHFNKFKFMTSWFHRCRYSLIITFFIFAVIDFILLELSDVQTDKCDYSNPAKNDCPYLNPEEHGIRYITRSLTIFCGCLFLCCIMAFWERVSYFSAHSTWLIAILYMSIIGGIFLYFARCLEPPPKGTEKEFNWSWHQRRSTDNILSIVVKLMIFCVLFLVMMGAIAMAIFGEAARASENLGTWAAMIIFFILAHLICITPLAPGSIIDICAGFLFVTLFVNNEEMKIGTAFIISLILTITLHFSGSCAQYYVGKIPSVQIWANKTLPPEMLAASDSVLQTANWFKVGIVGQVFMDTANGLNQGRMNMKFCTQFWSEYASIPNAIGLVLLGTVLVIPSFGPAVANSYSWAQDAIPLVIMVTSLWQMIASSWGAKELLQSSGTVQYWTALEKWSTVQYFYKLGYVPTNQGWENDCYEIGKSDTKALLDVIEEYRANQLSKECVVATSKNYQKLNKKSLCSFCKSLCSTPQDPDKQRKVIQEQKKLQIHAIKLRQTHWDRIISNNNFDELIKNNYLKKTQKEIQIQSFFQESSGIKMFIHLFLVICIFLSGCGSYLWIAKPIELTIAVQEGINVLTSKYTDIKGWICLCIFWGLIIIYYHREVIQNMKEFISSLKYICLGCKTDNQFETVFDTPLWENAPIDKYKTKTTFLNSPLNDEDTELQINDQS